MKNPNNNQDLLTNAAREFYGGQKKKEEEEKNLRNSLLNDLGNKIEAKHVLYSSNDDLARMKDEMQAPNGAAPINNLTDYSKNSHPTGGATPASNKNSGMIPIRDLKNKQEYLKQGMCKPTDEKAIPGVNACSSDFEIKYDNRKMKPETYAKLREFLGMQEGAKLDAYQDGGGVWTIGYGHTKGVKPGDKITKEQAEKLFEEDMKEHLDSLKHVKVKLSENQKLALGDLIFNIGGTTFYRSDLLKKLNNKDYKGAANELDLLIHDSKGKVEQGLVNRRKKEKKTFLTPDEY